MPYIGKTPSQATRARYYLTASGSETSISGSMTTGGTLTFTDGNFVDVSVNGVALVAGTDYNTNTANTISGLTALTANDQVEIIVYDTFSVFSGDVDSDFSVGGNLSVTGTTALTGVVTANAGVVVDNITIDGTEIDLSSGDLTLDVAGDLIFDADDGAFIYKDGGVEIFRIGNSSSSPALVSAVSDKDIIFKGNDGGSTITALTLDMSAAGAATFNAGATFADGCTITTADNSAQLTLTSTDADGSAGPILVMNRDSGSPDNGDVLGQILYKFDNAAAESTEAIRINGILADKTDGSEDARFEIKQMFGGSMFSFQTMSKDGIIFNQDGADIDFRIEGDTDANLFVVNAGNEKISIGTATNDGFLHINKNFQSDIGMSLNDTSGSGGTAIRFKINGTTHGSISYSGSGTSFNTSSDYRLKENVSYNWDATTRLKQLKPARFNFISDDTNTLVDGFLAHEVSNVVPEAINGAKDAVDDNGDAIYQGIDQSKLVPLLVKTIQELEARIATLEAK